MASSLGEGGIGGTFRVDIFFDPNADGQTDGNQRQQNK